MDKKGGRGVTHRSQTSTFSSKGELRGWEEYEDVPASLSFVNSCDTGLTGPSELTYQVGASTLLVFNTAPPSAQMRPMAAAHLHHEVPSVRGTVEC